MAVPNLSGALNGWTERMPVKLLMQTVERGIVKTEVKKEFAILGNLQPTSTKQMQDSGRDWSNVEWTLLVAEKENSLQFDDIVLLDGLAYQVKVIDSWQRSGFNRYGLTESGARNIQGVA